MNGKFILILFFIFFFSTLVFSQEQKLDIDKVVALAEKQFGALITTYPDSTKYPRGSKEDSSINLTSSRAWTSGFFAGNLWYLHRFTGKENWKNAAIKWTESLEQEKNTTNTHDLGFILYNSFGNGHQITQNPKYREVILQGSATLIKRFNPVVGAIRSWDFPPFKYPVIIDNLMNLEMLLWAAKESKDKTFKDIVVKHAETDLKHRFRKDNSSFHVLDFDPATGKLLEKITHQGLADSSCWARGQAWGIYGYTMLFRETGDKKYLKQAIKAADYFINEISKTEDHIPYWDFNDPAIPNTHRDASAGAIAASAFIELSQLSGEEKYFQEATTMLKSLSSDKYLSAEGENNFFLLKHCVGHKPKNSEVDVPLVYADYYFLEALWRFKNMDRTKF